jgi:hypothetical protein
MEKSVARSNRVLMICTETYVRKANDGQGGVGYEAMIVTGELVRDLGTSKFIPVVRQSTMPRMLPASVSTRYFVDLSDGNNFEEQVDVLLREIHQVPPPTKPPLGKNPYVGSRSGDEELIATDDGVLSSAIIEEMQNVSEIYRLALKIARRGDILEWRDLVRRSRSMSAPKLKSWRAQFGDKAPIDSTLINETLAGVSAYGPQMAIALAGVGSGQEKFRNQIALLDDLLFPKDWDRIGFTARVNLPEAAGYVYQALLGATCLYTFQLKIAMDGVQSQFKTSNSSKSLPVWRSSDVIGWPQAFGNSLLAWQALTSLPDKWPWLVDVFGEKEEFITALCAYYMSLNVLEYASVIGSGSENSLKDKSYYLEVPPNFYSLSKETKRRGYRQLLQDAEQVRDIWKKLNAPEAKVREHWRTWIEFCTSAIGNHSFARYQSFGHESLVEELFSNTVTVKK